MTFATPIALAALVLVPALLVAYLVVQRRRVKYAVRFTNLAAARRRGGPLASLAAARPAAADPRGALRSDRRDRTAPVGARRAAQAGHGHPDDRPVGLDARHRRVAEPHGGGEARPRPPSSEGCRAASRSGSSRSPTRRTSTCRRPPTTKRRCNALNSHPGRERHGARRRDLAVRERRAREHQRQGRAEGDARSSSSSSPTARARPATCSRSRRPTRPRRRRCPVYTVALGTQNGTITINGPNGDTRTYNVPPDPTTLRAVAQTTGGKFFEARRRRLAEEHLQRDRQDGRHEDREARAVGGVHGRRRGRAAARLGAVAGLVQPAPVAPS